MLPPPQAQQLPPGHRRVPEKNRGLLFYLTAVAAIGVASLLLTIGGGGVVTAQETTDAQGTDPQGAIESITADQGPHVVHVVPIHGEINRAQVVLVRRAVEAAKAGGATHLIVEIDTFGGRVDSALQITTLIGSLPGIRTITYVPVNSEGTGVSWSAGALISMATGAIYMAPGTSMGAATPVVQQGDGSVAASDEKTLSAVRTQMAALAEKNGHPRDVALAMVDRDIELFEVLQNGKLIGAYSQEGYQQLLRDQGIAVDSTAGTDPGADAGYGRGNTISPAGKLLTLTAGQMERYAVSDGSPPTYDDLYALLEIPSPAPQELTRTENDSLDNLIAFLTSGAVVGLLILVGMIGIFLEINSPGFGVPGVIGILAFGTVFGANFFLGRVGSLEILLLLAGVILLVIELFLIPGFGVTGILGLVSIGAALVLSQQEFTVPEFSWQWQILSRNVLVTFGSVVGGLLFFLFLTPVIAKGGWFSRIALTNEMESSKGYTVQAKSTGKTLMGASGTALSTLRPTGRARIGERVVIVESEGEFIDANSAIKVVQVDSNRVVVRKT